MWHLNRLYRNTLNWRLYNDSNCNQYSASLYQRGRKNSSATIFYQPLRITSTNERAFGLHLRRKLPQQFYAFQMLVSILWMSQKHCWIIVRAKINISERFYYLDVRVQRRVQLRKSRTTFFRNVHLTFTKSHVN